MSPVDGLERFNALPAAEAEAALLSCCASPVWAGQVLAARPYPTADAFRCTVDSVFAGLSWAEVEDALAGHPRLGEQAAGIDRSAAWSAAEQAGVAASADATRAARAAGNAAYERRFGHVYLACATGRTGAELLALLTGRLRNDTATERVLVRAELRKITWLRLGRLLEDR